MLADRADVADASPSTTPPDIRGIVALEHRDRPVAGVTVTAFTHDDLAPAARTRDRALGATIGNAVTGSDGTFAITGDPADPYLARWLCAAPHCDSLTFTLRCTDRDGTVLLDTAPRPLAAASDILLLLPASGNPPAAEHWMAFGDALEEHQLLRLGEIATELATLAPRGVFSTMSVQQRLATLGAMEQALLDPQQLFSRNGITLSVALLDDDDALQSLQERLRRDERPELLEALDNTVAGFRTAGGWDELDVPVAVERFKRGDYLSGVNQYIEQPGLFPGIVGGAPSPTIGYRDYLRNRWIDNQRFRQVLGAPNQELATRGTMIQRLNSRFHQDFATGDVTEQPANRILVRVLQAILVAPGGVGYGFGIVPPPSSRKGRRATATTSTTSSPSPATPRRRSRTATASTCAAPTSSSPTRCSRTSRRYSASSPTATRATTTPMRSSPTVSLAPTSG